MSSKENLLCQCCLSSLGLEKADGEPVQLLDLCFSIQITDKKLFEDSPCFICDVCYKKLKDSYAFKLQIEDSQLKLRNAYVKSISDDLQDFSSDNNIFKVEYLSEEDLHSNFEEVNDDDDFSYEFEVVNDTLSDSVGKKKEKNGRIKRSIMEDSEEFVNESSSILENSDVSPRLIKRIKPKSNRKATPTELAHIRRARNRYRYAKSIPYKLDETAVNCHLCEETFSSHRFLVSHMAVHYPNHICDLCGKAFVLKEHLGRHIRTHDIEKVLCPVCNRSLKKTSLSRHLKSHSGNNEAYVCPYCPERFVSFSTRINHMAKIHDVDVFKYHCKICSKKFHLSNSLSKHVRRCHFQELNATCEECGKGFFDKKSLKEHMSKHTGEKNFQCQICFKSYARKCTLREHMKNHCNTQKKYQCTLCCKLFSQKVSLKAHNMKVHQNDQMVLEEM